MNNYSSQPVRPARFRSLKSILTFALVALSVTTLLVVSSLELLLNFRAQQQAVAGQVTLAADEASDAVSQEMSNKVSILATTVAANDLSAAAPDVLKSTLGRLIGMEPSFNQVVLWDSAGKELARSCRIAQVDCLRTIPEPVTAAIAALNTSDSYFGPVTVDPESNEPIVLVAVPVKNVYHEYKGVLAAEVRLRFMWNLVSEVKVGQNGLAYVVDEHGNLIAFADESRILKRENLSGLAEVAHFLKNESASLGDAFAITPGIRGNLVVSAYVPLANPRWAVIAEMPVDEAYAGLITMATQSALILTLGAILAGLVGLYLARRITKPVLEMRDAADKMSNGDLSVRMRERSETEIGELAHAFNVMVARLAEVHGNLEREVEKKSTALLASERLYRIYIENQQDVIFSLDNEGRVEYVSPQAQQHGANPAELTGQKFLEVIAAEDRPVAAAAMADVLSGVKKTAKFEMRWNGPRGLEWFEVSLSPLKDPEGAIKSLAGNAHDISDRKQYAEDLKKSEERFRTLFEASPEGLILTDTNGFVIDGNRIAENFIGYNRDELVGESIFKTRALEKLGVAMTTQILSKSLAGQGSGPLEFQLTNRNGVVVPAELVAAPLALGDKKVLLWVMRDVTERRRATLTAAESERRYRAIIESTTDLVLSFDKGLSITFVSSAADRYGWESQALVGLPLVNIMQEENRAAATEILHEVLTKAADKKIGFAAKDRQGKNVWFEMMVSPTRDRDGHIIGGQGVARDVTDRQNIREQLAASEKRYRTIIEKSRDLIMELDPSGKVLFVSPSVSQFGIDASGVGAKLFDFIHPDDRERVEAEYARSLTEGDETPTRCRIINPRGEVFWAEDSSSMIRDENGQVTGIISIIRNITDRVRVEEGLREGEERLRNIINNTPNAAIAVFDQSHRVLFWNRAAEKLFGQMNEEVVGKDISRAGLSVEVTKRFEDALRYVEKTGHPFGPLEQDLTQVGEHPKKVLSTVFAIGSGEQRQFVSMDVDISEVRRMEVALAESQSRYESLVDNLNVGIYRRTSGSTGHFVECNDAFVRIFEGGSRNEALDMKLANAYLDMKDNGRFEKIMGKEGLVRNMEIPLRTLKGRDIWVTINAVRREQNGEIYYDGTVEDITDRRSAEGRLMKARQQYDDLLGNLHVGVFRVVGKDPDRFVFANEALWRNLGVVSFEELSQEGASSYFADPSEYARVVQEALQAGSVRNAEIRMRFGGKKAAWVRLALFRKTGEDGLDYVDGLIEDITEAHRAEEQLREAERMRYRFIQVVSHQLRTPLNSMRWSLESLLAGEVGELRPEQKNFLEVVLEADRAVISRIRDMVSALDIEEGRAVINKEHVRVEDLCNSVVLEAVREGRKKDVRVEYQPPVIEIPPLLVDAEKMREVFRTLVDNAIVYTSAGGLVQVKLKALGEHVRFEVTDTGVGIPKAEQPRLFSRFYRATNASLMKPDASGLGLSIAKYYVEQHGGRIGFVSEEGKGSTFWFELPLRS